MRGHWQVRRILRGGEGVTVARHEFMLKLNREVSPEEVEALYEAGCGDAGVETGPLGALLDFDREAPSLAQAIASAVRDIEKVPGLRAVGVRCDNMVTALDIASRAGVSREAVRLWATGDRGPGGFPKPVLITTGGEKIWDWEQVISWIERKRTVTVIVEGPSDAVAMRRIRILGIANRVLAARDALLSEPDESVRQEFERLLEDA
jgi:hypothetical protein